MNFALLLALSAATCPTEKPLPDAPGLVAVGKLPAAQAMRKNGEGKQLYREERWEEARAKYQAALAADPDLLGAQLNVACSFSRQGRYVEAAKEAATLIRRAFVPWNREVAEAADLGVLQDQKVYARIRLARSEAALRWGKAVEGGILFVARTRPPLHLAGEGVLVLGLHQELFAWIPETGRYFQVTAEDGKVLAYAVSADRRRVAYLMADKIVRQPGQAALLRGLAVRVLDIPTMALDKTVVIPGDVRKVRLWFAAVPLLKVTDAAAQASTFRLLGGRLEPISAPTVRAQEESVELSGHGVEPSTRRVARRDCKFALVTLMDSRRGWRISVSRHGAKPFALDARYGAGLAGLPFPAEAPARPPGTESDRGAGKK